MYHLRHLGTVLLDTILPCVIRARGCRVLNAQTNPQTHITQLTQHRIAITVDGRVMLVITETEEAVQLVMQEIIAQLGLHRQVHALLDSIAQIP